MSGVNKAILIGFIGRDPEIRYTKGGQPVCNFDIATSEKWKDKSGESHEKTEWHKIVIWGKQAEVAGELLQKGKQVYIEGKLQTREWEDNDGNKRSTTEIVASTMTMLGQAGRGSGSSGGGRDAGCNCNGDPDCPNCDLLF